MDDKQIFKFLENEHLAIEFAQSVGLIPLTGFCCGKSLFKSFRVSAKSSGFYFRCSKKNCRKEVSIKKNTFFSKSKLRVGQILGIIFYFVHDEVPLTSLMRKLEIKDEGNVVDWLSFCREICEHYFLTNPVILGGDGIVVEVDETQFVKRKYNVGRNVRSQWVFGAYEPGLKKGFLFAVPDCTRDCIFPLITAYIRPGTIIHADGARIYDSLVDLGYGLERVNHKIGQFVNYENNATTNHVESYWGRAKLCNKKRIGTHRTTLVSHLFEFNWREIFGKNVSLFIEHIKLIYNFN